MPPLSDRDRTASSIQVAFVAGLGRSGSTLLDRLLGQLPGWWSLGEVLHLWQRGVVDNEMCGCGKQFSLCPIWGAIGETAFGGWSRGDAERILRIKQSVERDRYIPRLLKPQPHTAFASRLREYNELLTRLYLAVREVTEATTLVDSGKHVSAALVLRNNPNIDLRVIHLVRDSRGVAHSSNKVMTRHSSGADELMFRMSPFETSLRYLAYNSILTGAFRRNRFRLRYEDLVADPDRSVANVCRWVTHQQCNHGIHVELPVQLTSGHGIGGNPKRMQSGPTALRADEEWRRAMPLGTKLLVTGLTAPSLVQNRYSLCI